MQRSIDLFKIKLPMLTMGMFWACPKKWISTDGKNIEFANTKGITEAPKSAADYINWLPKIREVIGGDGVEFSRQAHLWSLSQKGETSANTVKNGKSSWWQRFFISEEQGYAAFELFHEACKALGVTDTKGASAKRVSFTNTKRGEQERLRLNCANTLVLEVTSNPAEQPNARFIARIEELGNEQKPVRLAGKRHGLYAVDLTDLLVEESAKKKLFLNALGDIANTYKKITKRHFENAHRPRLLYAAYHKDRRADMLANGPTKGPADEEIDTDPIIAPSKHESAKNLILYGPPGTGKTYSTIDRALEIIDPELVASTTGDTAGRKQRKARFDELLQAKRIGFVTFHQSFSYEDFVEGLKASTDQKGQVKYEVEDGIFKQMCSAAAASSDDPIPYVLIIDEINRGNISRVFGELITLVEDSKRAGEPEALSVKLPYSKEMFSVPSNLHLIGTMNTADRSLAQVDIALRRRFVFEELMPDTTVLKQIPLIEGIDVARMLTAMNSRIEILYDREHTIGHAFFISLRNNPTITELEQIFVGKILPLLEEYFFEDWEKIRLVLGDHQKPNHLAIIQQKYSETQLAALFGQNTDYSIRNAYQRNQASLKNPACYVGIYEPTEASAKVSSPLDL
ncbi:MAG: hypothetical protein EAZ81_09520 [Verrucomicrobia bacterium]|nr:MAG: hypothetical protein EAZ81_09520 [Verrucomicrobiota bacterium]